MARIINGTAAAVSCELTPETGVLTLVFADGRTLTLAVSALSLPIRAAAEMHGLKQKLGDAAAISRDPLTGKAATIDTKYAAVREIFDRITSPNGTWNKVRGGEGASSTGVGGLLYRALVRLYDGRQTPEQVRVYLAGLTAEQQAALRTKNPRIRDTIAEIKVEDAARRAETGEDDGTDEMLANGLGPIPE